MRAGAPGVGYGCHRRGAANQEPRERHEHRHQAGETGAGLGADPNAAGEPAGRSGVDSRLRRARPVCAGNDGGRATYPSRRGQLRRRRADVLPDLPPKLAGVVELELTHRQRATYRRAHEQGLLRLRTRGRDLRITHVLELILRLKQICNVCPDSGESTKLADLRERLAAVVAAGEKALVFSQFVEEPFGARWIARELADLSPVLLTGDLDAVARTARVADFERDPGRRVMVLSLRAGGVGLNLTGARSEEHTA